MPNIKLKIISLENFKGCKSRSITFGEEVTEISGQNASGKSTILDGFLWLLFGKDSSGSASFGIRPVDENGKEIDNVEISVEAVLNVDGKDIAFKKVQKQKWTKHRGSSAPTYEGNVNSYEVDGFPQNEKEYKAKIAEIISEEDFKLIADLRYFANLDWKKKKELLLKVCGDITDEDVLSNNPEYWLPIADDIRTADAQKSLEKAKKQLRELNKFQKEMPVRIDEISKQIREVPDTSELEAKKAELTKTLESLESEYDQMKADKSEAELQKRQEEIESKIARIVNEETEKIRQKKEGLYRTYIEAKNKYNAVLEQQETVQRELDRLDHTLANLRDMMSEEGQRYHEIENRELDPSASVCKCCGQTLPPDQINKINADFLARKKADLDASKAKGWEYRHKIDDSVAKMESLQKKRAELTGKLAVARDHMSIASQDYESCPDKPDLLEDLDVRMLHDELESINTKLASMNDFRMKLDEKRIEIIGLKGQINSVQQQIADTEALKKTNYDIEVRIEELQEEQREVGQKIALTEQKVILLEEFSIKKSEMLSQKITSCFEMTNFSLFNQQINGAVTEECEITLKGVKYKDMNSGHRIFCAMDIVKTFSKKIGVTAPLFIDNAESINSYNIPKMDCQLILLKVTDDPELVVKVA